MNKEELDVKITEVAKSILSYCIARTSNQIEAEDLAQDIMLEICKSVPNLKNEEAFYGFMWAIAGNVYKEWGSESIVGTETSENKDYGVRSE